MPLLPPVSFAHALPSDALGAFVVGPWLLARGSGSGPLAGRTFAVKDLFDVAGTRTGAGNPDWLADAAVATSHAAAVAALLDGGADCVGKTVTDELGFSLSGTNVHYGTPHNPAAPGRVPGGSSSGSAAAVAGGMVDVALGTDTGGSVRVPASYCGIVGLRPSHGRVDGRGVFLLAPSFCTVGLLARDGETLAAAWASLARAGAVGDGPEPSREVEEIVVVPELMALAGESAARSLTAAAREVALLLGLPVVERPIGGPIDLDDVREAFRTIQTYEAWQLHGEWITRRAPDFGPGVASRFAAGSRVTPTEVAVARATQATWRETLDAVMSHGLLAQPAASGAAPRPDLGTALKDELRRRTLALTAPAGLAGAPVVSLPLGSDGALPLGLALCGRAGDDELLVRCAAVAVPGPSSAVDES